MLSRITTQSFRGLSHSSKLVSRVQGGSAPKQNAFKERPTIPKLPANEKVEKFARVAVPLAICGSAFSVLGICVYGMEPWKKRSIQESTAWPQYVRDRLTTTYGYLAASLVVSAAVGLAVHRKLGMARNPEKMMGFLQGKGFSFPFRLEDRLWMLGGLAVSGALAYCIPYKNTLAKHAAWLLYSADVGAAVALTAGANLPLGPKPLLFAAGLFAALSAMAMRAPTEKFVAMREPLLVGSCILAMAMMAKFAIFQLPAAAKVGLTGAIMFAYPVLVCSSILCDTQRAVNQAKNYPTKEQIEGSGIDESFIKTFDPIRARVYFHILF